MFDDITNQQKGGSLPENKPLTDRNNDPLTPAERTFTRKASGPDGVDDIFFDADNDDITEVNAGKEKPGVFRPKSTVSANGGLWPQPENQTQPNPVFEDDSKAVGGLRKLAGIAVIILVLAIIGGGAYFAYKAFFSEKGSSYENTDEIINENSSGNNVDISGEPPIGSVVKPVPVTPKDIDTDQDGLSDAEELVLGTDANKKDTDDDGLFDREEVKVYLTDPKTADTDGDGFSDGEEVSGGYNPKGSGRLYQSEDYLKTE